MEILIVTNMYPHKGRPYDGIFVKEQVDAIKEQCAECNIDVFHIKGYKSPLNYLKAIFELRRALRGKEYDLIHAHYGLSGLVSIFQRRIPVICTFHGSDVLYVRWQSFVSKIITIFLTHSIAVSSEIARKLPGNKILVIPCGVDMSFFSPMDKDKARKKLNLNLEKKYLLFPGNPKRKVKNYPLFKEVLALLKKDFQVKEIVLSGFDRKEVKYALNAADLVLITSKSEASNMVLKEALACNTPVVSVNVGDAAEQLEGLESCEITSSNPEDICRTVYKILKKGKIECSYREKISYFSSKYIAKRIVELYRNAIGDL